MDFFNRIHEINRLYKALDSANAGLIVVYGRRRMGKTRLLKQIKKDADIYFMADQREAPVQIKTFARLIGIDESGIMGYRR